MIVTESESPLFESPINMMMDSTTTMNDFNSHNNNQIQKKNSLRNQHRTDPSTMSSTTNRTVEDHHTTTTMPNTNEITKMSSPSSTTITTAGTEDEEEVTTLTLNAKHHPSSSSNSRRDLLESYEPSADDVAVAPLSSIPNSTTTSVHSRTMEHDVPSSVSGKDEQVNHHRHDDEDYVCNEPVPIEFIDMAIMTHHDEETRSRSGGRSSHQRRRPTASSASAASSAGTSRGSHSRRAGGCSAASVALGQSWHTSNGHSATGVSRRRSSASGATGRYRGTRRRSWSNQSTSDDNASRSTSCSDGNAHHKHHESESTSEPEDSSFAPKLSFEELEKQNGLLGQQAMLRRRQHDLLQQELSLRELEASVLYDKSQNHNWKQSATVTNTTRPSSVTMAVTNSCRPSAYNDDDNYNIEQEPSQAAASGVTTTPAYHELDLGIGTFASIYVDHEEGGLEEFPKHLYDINEHPLQHQDSIDSLGDHHDFSCWGMGIAHGNGGDASEKDDKNDKLALNDTTTSIVAAVTKGDSDSPDPATSSATTYLMHTRFGSSIIGRRALLLVATGKPYVS